MKRILLLLSVGLLFSGCASMFGIKKASFPLRGGGTYQVSATHHESLSGNWVKAGTSLYSKGMLSTEIADINCYLFEDGSHMFVLSGTYIGGGWIFLEKISISTDGEVVVLKDKDPIRTNSANTVTEIVNAEMPPELIEKVMRANSIGIEILDPVMLDEKQMDIVKSFITDFEGYTYRTNPFGF